MRPQVAAGIGVTAAGSLPRGYAFALRTALPHVVRVLDAFHVLLGFPPSTRPPTHPAGWARRGDPTASSSRAWSPPRLRLISTGGPGPRPTGAVPVLAYCADAAIPELP